MGKQLRYLKDYLKRKKLRYTKQRAAIVGMFLSNKGHLCIDELYYKIRRKYPNIGYTTVYRTFHLLKNAKMASEVNFTGRRRRFEHAFDRQHHDHFFCVSCAKAIEFFDPVLEKQQEKLCKKYNFISKGHQMQIVGVCRDCQKREEKNDR